MQKAVYVVVDKKGKPIKGNESDTQLLIFTKKSDAKESLLLDEDGTTTESVVRLCLTDEM